MIFLQNGSKQEGFTLIEALVAVVVLAIGVFSLYSMQITAIDGNAKAARITYGSSWVADQIEYLLTLPYDDDDEPLLVDTDGDGTGQDGDGDGIDDDDPTNTDPSQDFGLNHTGNDADHSVVSPDGRYTIFWNIAVDQRMDDLKSIRVIVQYDDMGETRNIVMDYIKPRT